MDKCGELLMVGMHSTTHRINDCVFKVARIDDEAEITQENARAMMIEANVYKILGSHERIASCLYISPTKDVLILKFYHNGTLKDHIIAERPKELQKWARQMIEAVQWIHSKGVRHSDIRLEQWFLDSGLNARLGDFNTSGYDDNPTLGLQGAKALGVECASHFMPRDPCEDNTIQSDLFALGSALYELETGSAPFVGKEDETITSCFAQGDFPPISHLSLGSIISGCWRCDYVSATEVLCAGETSCGL
ncbi:kinase-like protein [Aureobasidium pullulans]|nr:kinase-like protein [Aureobasidium pullulans]